MVTVVFHISHVSILLVSKNIHAFHQNIQPLFSLTPRHSLRFPVGNYGWDRTVLYESVSDDDSSIFDLDEIGLQQEFDIDEITSIADLNKLSLDIGGPIFPTDDNSVSLEEAKERIWDFVEDVAEDDIENMCMGQLSGLMAELGGELEDGISIEDARDRVW
eukprot:CAMPEP_0194393848 /NCGR_PEP_ID=MMETSP0174-20130528/123521_1 /TAXON_ID=216777 /ORGANISM="Proboscia alata, Strain PI-D3" /LENGTH=160 /DNA_ID=CAMNT_0039189569 /DNA_START=143 /DNA_END=622 /DNA_ORIENTATION=+